MAIEVGEKRGPANSAGPLFLYVLNFLYVLYLIS
jgi:hypothetical protein